MVCLSFRHLYINPGSLKKLSKLQTSSFFHNVFSLVSNDWRLHYGIALRRRNSSLVYWDISLQSAYKWLGQSGDNDHSDCFS